MELYEISTAEECANWIYNHTNLEHWPKICKKCNKKITKIIVLRMSLVLPELEENHQLTGDEEITIVKESYCKKCSKSLESGMIVELFLP